jgi:hypothetical protein
MKRFRRIAARPLIATAAVLFLAGCNNKGTVTGKVTLNGQPLPGGLVYVSSEAPETEAFAAAPNGGIRKDGTYTVRNVPIGKARITVVTAKAFGSATHPDAVKDPWGPYVPIPDMYMDGAKTPFKLEVKPGRQSFDIAMTGEVAAENKP